MINNRFIPEAPEVQMPERNDNPIYLRNQASAAQPWHEKGLVHDDRARHCSSAELGRRYSGSSVHASSRSPAR